MPLYKYKALDPNGNVVKGSIILPDSSDVYEWLKSNGLLLLNLRRDYIGSLASQRITERDIIEFSRQMYYILRSGSSLLEGLSDIISVTKNREFRRILESVRTELQSGKSFSDSLSSHPKAFPGFYISIVAAGEASGSLDKSFQELTRYLEWVYDIKHKIKNAFIYPTIVSILVVVALVVFIVFVIPKLVSFLKQLNIALPWTTKALIAFDSFMTGYWYIPIGVIVSILAFITISRLSRKMMFLWDKYKLKLPYLGKLFLDLSMLRFSRYLGMLYKSGLPIFQSMDILKEVISNRFYGEKVEMIKTKLSEGETFASALEEVEGFPLLFIRNVKIGETTGNLEQSFEELSLYFEDELDRSVKKLITIIEPALLLFVASIIIVIIIAVLFPIYNMLGKIG